MTSSTFGFTYCAASTDGSIYIAGVDEELEERDVRHTFLWERVDGAWDRYRWSNRTYGLCVYPDQGKPAAAYMGYEGTLKVRGQVKGSAVEVLESGDDAPSSLRSVTGVRQIGEHLYVVGMRRMVYRRRLDEAVWQRFDNGLRLTQADTTIAGLRSIDGDATGSLLAVGLEGEIWSYIDGGWVQEASPTNVRLTAVRRAESGLFVIGGANGSLFVGGPGRWQPVAHDFAEETFRCIERWSGRWFLGAESGSVYELHDGATPTLSRHVLDGLPFVAWLTCTPERIFFLGRTSLRSLGDDGWRDESPPATLLA
jgi:hypothetical protein